MDISRIIGIISLLGTAINGAILVLNQATQFWPGASKYAAVLLIVSGIISAITGRVQGRPQA